MTVLRVWVARLKGLFRGAARDQALTDEMQAHLDDLADDFVERGLSPEDAIAAARRTFGGLDQIKEAYRDQRGWPSAESVARDVRLALRLLAAQPGSAALTIVCLGLGIGVSMALFTVVNAFCLRGLPIDHPDRVLFLTMRDREAKSSGLSYADFQDVRRQAASFTELAAYAPASINAADDRDLPQRVVGCFISAAAFRVLGVSPEIGRGFDAADESSGAPPVGLIGHAVWLSRYGGDPSVIGRTVRLNAKAVTIVGVMPEGFAFPNWTDVWLPITQIPGLIDQPRSARGLSAFGRLMSTSSVERARDELQAIGDRLDAQYPATNQGVRFSSVPINDVFMGKITQPEWLAFLTAGVLVLLVACANVANVFLSRLDARSREVALRLAMGATRGRIVRQFLIESLVLAALAGTVGLGFAVGAVWLLAWSVPSAAPLPYWVTFAIDTRVLSTLIATCMASVVVFGLVPAMQGSRIDVNGLLKEGGRSGTGSRRARFWSAAFLTVEFALTLVLLANVSMDLQREFLDEGPGLTIDPAPLLTARLTLPAAPYATPEDRRRFYARLNEAVGHLAGVVSMTTTNRLPPDNGEQRRLRLAGRAPGDDEGSPIAIVSIGPRYFETLGIPVIAGRDLLDEDSLPGREGVVVNQRLADRFFQGQGAIGQRVQIVGDQAAKTTPAWHTIVGIAPDVRQGPLPMPTAYVPDEAPPTAIVIVRTQSSPDALGPVVRSAVAALDDNLPLYRVVPLAVARHESSWNSRVSSDILHTITLIALLLAVVGLYGVTAHAVAQRTREIGIRVALGATARRVAWLVLRRALAYVGFGLAVGLLCTYVFERLFVDATVGPPLTSPRNLAVVVGLVMIVAVVACIRPASRAAHVEPVTALRAE